MTASAPQTPRPFVFDTEFDASGVVVTPSAFRPVKRSYLPAEVDALVAQARLEAREAALAEADSLRAMGLAAVGQAAAQCAPVLAAVAQAHREQAAELALAAARVIAASALDRFPLAPLRAALDALAREIDASPRLVVRAGGLDDQARAAIEAACLEAGFAGVVAFRDDPAAPAAAFGLEWADGRADYDPAGVAARLAAALDSALAAEAGHAEAVTPDLSPDRSAGSARDGF